VDTPRARAIAAEAAYRVIAMLIADTVPTVGVSAHHIPPVPRCGLLRVGHQDRPLGLPPAPTGLGPGGHLRGRRRVLLIGAQRRVRLDRTPVTVPVVAQVRRDRPGTLGGLYPTERPT